MHISYRKQGDNTYASAARSVRKGGTVQKEYTYIGRVINKEKGIYENKKLGIVGFDVESGEFTKVSTIDVPKPTLSEKLILDFGDSYFLDSYLRESGLMDCIDAIQYDSMDTVKALILYYITYNEAACHAIEWYEGNYARCLYPEAKLQSQRISEIFEEIGDEFSWRAFFSKYIPLVTSGKSHQEVAVDSTGLPNKARMQITAINSHNGKINQEIRMILIVDKETGMPIYLRYIPGNVIDATTLIRTLKELKKQGVNATYAVMDAGYCTEKNLIALFKNKVDFLTRLEPNRKLFKQIKAEYLGTLKCKENFVTYNKHRIYVKKIFCELCPGYWGYAYAVLNETSEFYENEKIVANAKVHGYTDEEVYDLGIGNGFFVLISSMDISNKELIPAYYVRQKIEQYFDVAKTYSGMLPLRVHSEETFRGHLLISFIASAVLQKLQIDLNERGKCRGYKENKNRTKNKAPNTMSALLGLRNHKCKVYNDEVLPAEPQKLANDVYKLFDMTVPYTIEIKKGV